MIDQAEVAQASKAQSLAGPKTSTQGWVELVTRCCPINVGPLPIDVPHNLNYFNILGCSGLSNIHLVCELSHTQLLSEVAQELEPQLFYFPQPQDPQENTLATAHQDRHNSGHYAVSFCEEPSSLGKWERGKGSMWGQNEQRQAWRCVAIRTG